MDIIAERKTKTIYKDNDTAVKLFVKDYSKADILNEALIHARVEENTNLNIPKLLEVKKYASRWAITTEYIEGETLESLMNKHPEKQDEYLEMFVKLQLEMLSNNVPLLNRVKDKYRRKLTDTTVIDDNTKYELLQRLEGMKNHVKLCHGDFNLSNVILAPNGKCYILDWSHATQGNASCDAAKTFLILSIQKQEELANKYLDMFAKESKIEKSNIQSWIPIVAATQLTYGKPEEEELLRKWIDIVDFQ